jgi:hypothetical protein
MVEFAGLKLKFPCYFFVAFFVRRSQIQIWISRWWVAVRKVLRLHGILQLSPLPIPISISEMI